MDNWQRAKGVYILVHQSAIDSNAAEDAWRVDERQAMPLDIKKLRAIKRTLEQEQCFQGYGTASGYQQPT